MALDATVVRGEPRVPEVKHHDEGHPGDVETPCSNIGCNQNAFLFILWIGGHGPERAEDLLALPLLLVAMDGLGPPADDWICTPRVPREPLLQEVASLLAHGEDYSGLALLQGLAQYLLQFFDFVALREHEDLLCHVWVGGETVPGTLPDANLHSLRTCQRSCCPMHGFGPCGREKKCLPRGARERFVRISRSLARGSDLTDVGLETHV
mmetsp:Transcript_71896/g.181400  ORF Transcript_71896/g.181400 Transcript_71896/m.181400 type:complete len:209 (-) Transcript_71896:1099-1725(-)